MKTPLQQRKERLYEGAEILARMSEVEQVALYNWLRCETKNRFLWLNSDEIDDVVGETILDVFKNRRAYPPTDQFGNRKSLSFNAFLMGVIRSKVSHDHESKCKRVVFDQHDESQSLEDWFDLIRYKEARSRGCDMSNPETDAIYKESCDSLRALVANDRDLPKIVELLIETPDLTRREIAEKLNMKPEAVYNALRRLHRMVNHAPGKEGNNAKVE